MRLKGRKFTEPFTDIIVFPRQDGDAIFKAKAIMSFAECDKHLIVPKPPSMVKPDGTILQNTKDRIYQEAYAIWADRRMAWIVIESLKATEGLEWETVVETDCATWSNWAEELKNSFFTNNEILQIQRLVYNVNSLNDSTLEDAKNSFLARQREAELFSASQKDVPLDMQSGLPVNGSA